MEPCPCGLANPREISAKAAEASRLLTALANEHRLTILCQLFEGERSLTSLAETVGLTQSALSQHLAKLRSAGVVVTRRDSRTIYYRLEGEVVISIMNTLAEHFCQVGSGNVTLTKNPEKTGDSK